MKSATIDTGGKVVGQLNDKDKTRYESRIPTALNDNTLAADLEQHDVVVKGTAAGTTFSTVVLGLLPFLLLIGLYFWISRRATRAARPEDSWVSASSNAKVYDEERPTTRFADVAGYEGAKREISEVVDFLKQPDRYTVAPAR